MYTKLRRWIHHIGHGDTAAAAQSYPPGTQTLSTIRIRQELTSAETTLGAAATAAPRMIAIEDSFMMTVLYTMDEMLIDFKINFYVLYLQR